MWGGLDLDGQLPKLKVDGLSPLLELGTQALGPGAVDPRVPQLCTEATVLEKVAQNIPEGRRAPTRLGVFGVSAYHGGLGGPRDQLSTVIGITM